MIQTQTNAAHSWGVAAIVDYIHPAADKGLILEALYHDVAEGEFGDMPAPGKKALGGVRQALHAAEHAKRVNLGIWMDGLGPEDRMLVKAADIFDLMFYCLEERELGNRNLHGAWRFCVSWCRNEGLNTLAKYPRAAELLRQLEGAYHGISG